MAVGILQAPVVSPASSTSLLAAQLHQAGLPHCPHLSNKVSSVAEEGDSLLPFGGTHPHEECRV